MAESRAVDVLLLARAGEARQRLETALEQAGARLLRSVDPAEGDPGEIIALRPGAVLVALEPAIEDALERYEALLSDPGVLVMFDEAEVAAQRDGWDAARWVRHLAAKLNGHEDVLPPGAESEDAVHPAPGPLPARDFDPSSLDIGALAEAAHDLAADVPRAYEPAGDADGPAGPDADADAEADAAVSMSFDGLVSAEDMDWSSSSSHEVPLDQDPALAGLLAAGISARPDETSLDDLDPADIDDDAGDDADADADVDADADADAGSADGRAGGSPSGNEWTLDMDSDDGLDLEAELEALEFEAGSAPASGSAPGVATRDADTTVAGEATDGADGIDAADGPDASTPGAFGGLSLADDDTPVAPPPAVERTDAIDLEALSARLDGLSLADPDSYGHGVLRGAVMVEAGLGGPDAVRQLLGGLGEEFARPVLVRLLLDGGRYDRLVQQMQRATALPVALAEAGAMAEAGRIYFLPPGVAVAEDRARLVFAAADADGAAGDDYAALPAADSALVFLSGADAARVDRAMARRGEGTLVLAQAPDTCYDATAVDALVGRGAVAAEPGDLAQALLDHWP